jgi:hypothetical protein
MVAFKQELSEIWKIARETVAAHIIATLFRCALRATRA